MIDESDRIGVRLGCMKVAAECATDRYNPANVVNFATALYDWVVAGGEADTPRCSSVERNPSPPAMTYRKRKDKA
jgi:hypothetical protein